MATMQFLAVAGYADGLEMYVPMDDLGRPLAQALDQRGFSAWLLFCVLPAVCRQRWTEIESIVPEAVKQNIYDVAATCFGFQKPPCPRSSFEAQELISFRERERLLCCERNQMLWWGNLQRGYDRFLHIPFSFEHAWPEIPEVADNWCCSQNSSLRRAHDLQSFWWIEQCKLFDQRLDVSAWLENACVAGLWCAHPDDVSLVDVNWRAWDNGCLFGPAKPNRN